MTNIIQYIIIGIQYIHFLKKQFYNHYDQKKLMDTDKENIYLCTSQSW